MLLFYTLNGDSASLFIEICLIDLASFRLYYNLVNIPLIRTLIWAASDLEGRCS
jgi:hypothetical protein